jgi:probable F420-dependent oxidoreductase
MIKGDTMGTASGKLTLGRFGVFGGTALSAVDAKEIEALGYGAMWVGNSPSVDLQWAEQMLESTTTLQVASGILNIWTGEPGTAAESFHRLEQRYPGRFLLGIGAGHSEVNAHYRSPLQALTDYFDKLDEYGVPKNRRLLGAMGPKMIKLGADRSAGVHPYLTLPGHTAQARAAIGPDAFLAPEHKVMLSTDVDAARAAARAYLGKYFDLQNATINFKKLGFSDEDVAKPGSDHLVDSFVLHGTAESIAARLIKHLDAGADHVPVQVISAPEQLLPTLTALAEPLGLR